MVKVSLAYLKGLPYAPGSPVCSIRSAPCDISHFFLRIQGVRSKFSYGLSRNLRLALEGGGRTTPVGSKAQYVSARCLLRIEARSLQARHVQIGFVTFSHSDIRSDTFFPFCQGLSTLTCGLRAAFENVCGHGIKNKKGPPNQ